MSSSGAPAGATTAAAVAAAQHTSSYRVKFKREQFLELIEIANPKLIYRRKNMYFFAFDGFVMYSDDCRSSDFNQYILEAKEFSNVSWKK